MTRIGVQAMMLRERFAGDGIAVTLGAVREIGYRSVEVSQVPMTEANVAALDRCRGDLGIEIPALSAPLSVAPGTPVDSLEKDFEKIVADAKRLGSTELRIPIVPFEALASHAAVVAFCERAEPYAARLRDEGLRLSYHNHDVDFTRYDGQHLLDIVVERAPHLDLEVDVHWVQRAGLDPVRTLEKYAGRVAMVHLKDYRIGRMSPDVFVQLERGDPTGVTTALADVVQFAEVGEGNLDFPAIIAEAQRQRVKHLFVEQDKLYGRSVLDALTTSHDNLVAMGFGDLF
jgi:sugar phosphate isomerase/epimerase